MDWTVAGFSLGVLALIGFLLLAYLTSNKKLKPSFRGPAEMTVRVISVCFFIGIGALLVEIYITESGWYPRTREVVVSAKANNWVTGELKMCFSSETPGKDELAYLTCDSGTAENHTLNVTFWARSPPRHQRFGSVNGASPR